MTDTERLQRIEDLFHRAMEQEAEARVEAVATWCGEDDGLRRDVLELLAADMALEQAMAASHEPGSSAGTEPGEDAWEGRRVGQYRLLRLLGRGGMGVVYLAERLGNEVDQQAQRALSEPGATRTKVAIKFIRRSLRGSPAVQHFLLERDTLAALQHPHVARVLDGGLTPELSEGGEAIPYIVMEFIEGERLDAVCDRPGVSAADVLPLMVALCEAVAFVHRHLVLHRDLKPGNVMVTREGAVKLLDFGTLKMLGTRAEPSAMTQAGMRPVTLRYAAPEHVLAEASASITTAADVYSLGVLLYRLLAGRLPPEMEGRDAAGQGVLPWFDRLREGRVTPPSRVATCLLPREWAADLDAIVLRAMRYAPEDRYPGAQALADDLRRVLEGKPVLARAGSTRYRLGKWYRRNRGGVWAGAAAAAVLLAGVLLMRHETGVARAQERAAGTGVEQERVLAHTLLFDYFDQLRALPGSTAAQKRAVTEAVGYLDGLSRAQQQAHRAVPERSASTRELQMDQVQGYTSMGSVLGSPYEDNLGQPDAAVAVLQRGVTLAAGLASRYQNDTDVLKAQASVNQALANVYVGEARMAEALAAVHEAAAVSERLAAQPTATAPELAVAASTHDAMGDLLSGHDGSVSYDPARAAVSYGQALAFDRRELALDPGFFRARRGVAVELHKLGLLQEDSDPLASTALHTKALDWLNAFSPQDRARPAVSRLYYAIEQHVGLLDVRIGKTAAGLALLRDVLARYRAVYAADAINDQALFDVADVEANLGESLQTAGRTREAVASLRASADDLATLVKHDPRNTNWAYREALMRYRTAAALGNAAEQRTAAIALADFARRPDFNTPDIPDVLGAMHATHLDPPAAFTLAQRLVNAAPDLDSYGLTRCAEAADAAGAREQAQRLASRALESLRRGTVATAEQREEIADDTAILHGMPRPAAAARMQSGREN